MSVTTSVDFPGVTAIVQNLNQTGRACNIELYRAQTGVGGAFNLVTVGEQRPDDQHQASINDNLSDDVIAEQEELFSDGGILGGTPLPGVSLVASFQGRVFVVSPESPQSLFYSNPDSAGSSGGGEGLLFDTTNLSLDIIDVHGPITAIQPMDAALIVFKGDAVYAVTGSGPDGTGQNGGYSATLLAAGIGTNNPRSVVLQVGSGTAADGVWFQSNSKRAGIFTVTRGLTVEYTGAGVRRYSDEAIISALVYPDQSQIRWYTQSGRTLVYDWISKIWGTNTGQPCLSAVLYEDAPTYAPTGSLAGYILKEFEGAFQEGATGSYVPYSTTVASPWLSLAQLKGYERIYRVQGVGRTVGAHTLTVQLYGDYSDTNLLATYTKTFAAPGAWDWEIRPEVQKLDAVKVVITVTDPSGVASAGASLTGITLVYGVKKGLFKKLAR